MIPHPLKKPSHAGTWNGFNRPPRQEGEAHKEIHPSKRLQEHTRDYFLFSVDMMKTINVPKAIIRLIASAMSISITSFREITQKGKRVCLTPHVKPIYCYF